MDLQLRGKSALVTGSTAGIDLAGATGRYREGASVVVNGGARERVTEPRRGPACRTGTRCLDVTAPLETGRLSPVPLGRRDGWSGPANSSRFPPVGTVDEAV
jgi:NAD(P)-dependent dehydrogenase (short-subunit alcohol dehydrogenase family)